MRRMMGVMCGQEHKTRGREREPASSGWLLLLLHRQAQGHVAFLMG